MSLKRIMKEVEAFNKEKDVDENFPYTSEINEID